MGFGTNLMKTLMFVFNGIVWILGLVMLIIGIIVLVEGHDWDDIVDGKTVPVSVLLVVLGIIVAVTGFLGCFGAMKQSPCMLLVYAIILFIIVVIQLVAGILAFVYSEEAIDAGHSGFVTAIANYDTTKPSSTEGINWLQKHLHCCGIQNASDWRLEADKAKIWITEHINDVPDHCCKRLSNQWNPTPKCGEGQALGNSPIINNEGCYVKMVGWLQTFMPLMGVTCLIFLVLEAVAIVVSFLLRSEAQLKEPIRLTDITNGHGRVGQL